MRKQRARVVNYLTQSQMLKFQILFRDSIFYQIGQGSHRGPEQAVTAELRVVVRRLCSLCPVGWVGEGRG